MRRQLPCRQWTRAVGTLIAAELRSADRMISNLQLEIEALRMAKQREFDFVLWGGSSFVGSIIAEHLQHTYGVDGAIRRAPADFGRMTAA